MGFLDKKERVFDIVLTDKGRELLSKNQLNFTYYAFSDEGVDYSGSLTHANSVKSPTSASYSETDVDNYIHKNLSFEAYDRKNNVKNLSSFLYTIPERTKVLPEFKTNVNVTASISLERRFYIDTVTLERRPRSTVDRPLDIVVRATVPKKTFQDRVKEYVDFQKLKSIFKILDKK
jgi:hypothetical protein